MRGSSWHTSDPDAREGRAVDARTQAIARIDARWRRRATHPDVFLDDRGRDNRILWVHGKDGPGELVPLWVKWRYGFDQVQHRHG